LRVSLVFTRGVHTSLFCGTFSISTHINLHSSLVRAAKVGGRGSRVLNDCFMTESKFHGGLREREQLGTHCPIGSGLAWCRPVFAS